MQSRDFCYWLQGYLEISVAGKAKGGLSEEQIECVKKHLALVFKHEIDPSFGDEKKQEVLNKIHSGRIDPSTVYRC